MSKQPNVLVLLTDQQRYDTIRAGGHSHVETPNLDRLVRDGCLFTHAHTTNPICVAARHDLITGMSGRFHGYFGHARRPIKDHRLPTLPRIFLENGYRTAAIGKMHFFPQREHHGFGELHLMEELPRRREDDAYASYLKEAGLEQIQNIHGVRPFVYHHPQRALMDEAHHGTTWVGDRTCQWLQENGGRHPFFLMASWIAPHPPWNLPFDWEEHYAGRELPEPIPASRSFPFIEGPSDWYGDGDSSEEKRMIRAAYFASITMVDKQVGRVLDALEDLGQLDDTLIIFTSDHGEMLQDKGFYSKELPYDGSVRIPFVLRYPEKVQKGSRTDAFVDLFDVLPTCLDACGLDYPKSERLPGKSLLAPDRTRNSDLQCASFGLGLRRWVMSRNRRYKYVFWYNCGTEEFFDMEADPGETVNLIGSEGIPVDEYRKLKSLAIDYERAWGPEGNVGLDGFIPLAGDRFHPNTCSKYPVWANMQTQAFNERPPKERGGRFEEELRCSVSHRNPLHVPDAVWSDDLWKSKFLSNWTLYTDGHDPDGLLDWSRNMPTSET